MRAGSSLMTSWENTSSSEVRDIRVCRCSTESSATTAAAVEHDDPRADALDDLQDVRAVEDRFAALGQQADQVAQDERRRHVET